MKCRRWIVLVSLATLAAAGCGTYAAGGYYGGSYGYGDGYAYDGWYGGYPYVYGGRGYGGGARDHDFDEHRRVGGGPMADGHFHGPPAVVPRAGMPQGGFGHVGPAPMMRAAPMAMPRAMPAQHMGGMGHIGGLPTGGGPHR